MNDHEPWKDYDRFESAMNPRLSITLTVAVVTVLVMANLLVARDGERRFAHHQTRENESALSTVYGHAIYHDSQQPVPRVNVVLRSLTSFGPEELSAITNARGEFRIERVPAGSYFIGVNGRGVVSTESFIELGETRAMRYDRRDLRKYFEEIEIDGKTDKQVVVRARRGGVITGKVNYANGDPAIDYPIAVLRRKGDRYSLFWTNVNTLKVELLTDDRGIFRVTGLPAGEYIVGATPMIEHGELVKDSALEANMIGSMLAMTFYPSTMLTTQATPISIEAGEEKTGIDITLQPQKMHTVGGIVRMRDDRRPVTEVQVRIIRKETDETIFHQLFWPYSVGMPGVNTDELGRWRLREVPDGRYIILVEPPKGGLPSETQKFVTKRQEIEVAGNVNNLIIELGNGATVSGTVAVESGPAPSSMYVGLSAEDGNSDYQPSTTVERAGRFVIRGVPTGKMYFFLNPAEGFERFYIKAITWNGKDLLREPVDVVGEEKIDNVKIVLSPQVATFIMRVRSSVGEPVENVALTLVPSDPARWKRSEAQLLCTTDAQGKCTLVGAPREYLIFTLPRGVQTNTLLPDEIEERAAAAQRVSLPPGERRTFDVVLPRGR